MSNTEITKDGTEVYTTELYRLADEYIQQRLEGKEDDVSKRFRDMIFYISDRIKKPSHEDIDELDKLFDAYVRLCVRYSKLPTIECFSFLTKIHRSTLDDWKNGRYRLTTSQYAYTVKGWQDTCKSFVIDELQNNSNTNINLIFVSKACYGLRETSPFPAPELETKQVLTVSQLPKLGDME